MKTRRMKDAFSLLLVLVVLLIPCFMSFGQSKNVNYYTPRTTRVSVSSQSIDCESIFNEFQNANLQTIDDKTTFEGTKTFNLMDFAELDNLSDTDVVAEANIQVKYRFSYEKETNLVTLSAYTMGDDGEVLVDTLIGAAFVNENGDLDALLDCGEQDYILLSDMQNLGMIENCGWFKKMFNKVAKTIKKVVSTTVGVIGAIATVALPVVCGVVMAATGVGLLATIAVGATVGAVTAGATAAASTYQQDGKVDWEAVGICAGVGAAVGAIASAASYGITKLLSNMPKGRIYQVAFAMGSNPLVITPIKLTYLEALSVLALYIPSLISKFSEYGLGLLTKNLFTTDMLNAYDILKNNNVGRRYIGIYTVLQKNAAALAMILGCVNNSKYDLAHNVNFYNHYHDASHTIHVWFGSPVAA